MSIQTFLTIATFTTPEQIGTNPQAMLWLLPLVVSIAVVYKATKLPEITASKMFRESASLFFSIIGFMLITALALYALVRIITE